MHVSYQQPRHQLRDERDSQGDPFLPSFAYLAGFLLQTNAVLKIEHCAGREGANCWRFWRRK